MKKRQVIGGIIMLIVVAGGSFYAGKSMASTATPAGARGAGFAGGAAGFPGRIGGARTTGAGFTGGTIVSSANGSISIKQQNGSSTEIILLSPTTQILKTSVGTTADLTTGTTVAVNGTTNSDGSLTATSVQIRPTRAN